MRSIALKLTLAFLTVGLIGALLVAIFVGAQTQREFDRFIFSRNQDGVASALARYYQTHGSWQGLEEAIGRAPAGPWEPARERPLATVVDASGRVVFGGRPERLGVQVPDRELRRAVPIQVDDQVVGYLLFDWFLDRRLPDSPEADFLRRINWAIFLSAAAAAGLALVLGGLLARTLTRPLRALTEATQAVAQGDLGHQVAVHSQDEIGELAVSFNRMSADLARASSLRKQMTADIAHDLRTPLSVLLGYTEALSDGKLRGTPEMYEVMYQEAQHLQHLIDDLRTLSLADAGELPLQRTSTAPRALLERAAAAFAPQAEKRSIRLTVQAAQDLPMMDVDPERMAQVLGNLVANALRYSPEHGEVTLAAQAATGAVTLSVRDQGPGIAPEDLPNIFERFYRADKARSSDTVTNGVADNGAESGLGLAIAKSIVEAHGGTITVESTPMQGSNFIVRLPA